MPEARDLDARITCCVAAGLAQQARYLVAGGYVLQRRPKLRADERCVVFPPEKGRDTPIVRMVLWKYLRKYVNMKGYYSKVKGYYAYFVLANMNGTMLVHDKDADEFELNEATST